MKSITIRMADLLSLDGKEGHGMAGRETGARLRERLASALDAQPDETLFLLDFAGIGLIDYSCADELFSKLLPRVLADEFGRKYLGLVNLSPVQMENIGVALERRGLAAAVMPQDGGWSFLGKLTPYLRETFRVVYDLRGISARELSERLDLSITTGSTRLLNLYKQRLVGRRENLNNEGFREYVYEGFNGGFSFA